MADDLSLIVCKPLVALTPAQAAATSSTVTACEWCMGGVWIVPRNLRLRQALGAKVACHDCAARLAAEELRRGGPVVVATAKPAVDALERGNTDGQ